jgi:1-acyl-sn-glycerol-3-phosphate acyltransferase
MARSRWYLDHGVSVLFFPEGTRSKDGDVQSFKAGAFKLALEAGVDVLPLAISGTANALPKHTWKFGNEQTPMRMLVGDVISTKGMTPADQDRLVEMTREAVIALKDDLDGRTFVPARARQSLRASA